jgi:hypothetical protein
MVCLALCVSRPQDWPPLFGNLVDVTSVRTFWALVRLYFDSFFFTYGFIGEPGISFFGV